MGGMRRLFQRDYPEFYDQFSGAAEVLDWTSRFGFYPGSVISIPMALFGAKNGMSQLGEVLPPWARTLHDILLTVAPDSTVAKMFDVIFPDRFRDFMTSQAVASQGNDGEELLRKKFKGDPLTPDEQKQWAAGSRNIGFWDTIMTQTGLFRYEPEEKRKLNLAVREVLVKGYGVSPSLIDTVRRSGQRIEDVLGPMPPETHEAITALDGYERFTGSSVVLGPSELTEIILLHREFWDLVADEKRQLRDDLISVERRVADGTATIDDWKRAETESQRTLGIFIAGLKGTPENPTKYSSVPLSLEERRAFVEAHNVLQPTLSSLEEIRNLWFSHPLTDALNYDTGLYGPDYDTFYSYRDALEMALPDDILQRLIRLNTNDDTKLQQHKQAIYKQYFRPYYKLFNAVIADFSPEEQALIKRHRRITDLDERNTIEQRVTNVKDAEGQQLISVFTDRLRTAHDNLREADPELDAWLAVYGEVTAIRSPQANVLYQQYKQEMMKLLR